MLRSLPSFSYVSSWSELKASSDAGMQIRRMWWLLVGTYERRLLFCLSALTHGSKDYVSQIGITHCERRRRHRARCVRGISREVSPSASSIPDAIVRVEVRTERLCDRQFALGGNNYERFKSLSGSNFRFYYLSNNKIHRTFDHYPIAMIALLRHLRGIYRETRLIFYMDHRLRR